MAVVPAKIENTSIKTSDGAVLSSPGHVYWILASAGATGGAWQINDSTDDSGTDKISAVSPANSIQFIPLNPPLKCNVGIYADIPGTNITLTVAYG